MNSFEARHGSAKPLQSRVVFFSDSANQKQKAVHQKPVISNPNECDFGNISKKNADIDTFDIFQSVDNEKMTTSRRGKHMDQFRQKSASATSSKLPLKIFLVPHSHSDPGWHKTVNGYFRDQTKPTLDNMVEKLQKFPNMTFVWAESVFSPIVVQ